MATDKKNRTQREDKEATASVDNGNTSDASASLHARRAKLRGALGSKNASFSNDPFAAATGSTKKTDPYTGQQDTYVEQPSRQTTEPDPYASQPDPFATQPNIFAAQPDPSAGQQYPYTAEEQYPYAAEESEIYAVQPEPIAVTTEPYASQPELFAQQAAEISQSAAVAETFAAGDQHSDYYEAPVNVYGVPITVETPSVAASEPVSDPVRETRRSRRAASASASAQTETTTLTTLPHVPDKTVELVNSIDQSLNICATNLAALQNLAGEQTDVLKGLSQTLQNQTLLEIGLNLNSLTESLTAALEPMKAIGELVPALDALVSTLEGKDQDQSSKMSPEQLVTNLSDQLSAGLIDPWTFKCAYMAVYPADHAADLLHRLVELLGSQRLSGDLFRAAYEAVQAAEPPSRANYNTSADGAEFKQTIVDGSVKSQLESLEKANRELQKRQEEREEELAQLLSHQEELNQRLEELNNSHIDASHMMTAREEEFRAALESKDMDIIEKDAELNMIRAQMEELRSSTEEMGKELQREMQELKLAATQAAQQSNRGVSLPGSPPADSQGSTPVNNQGFFDALPQANRQATGSFDTAPSPAKSSFSADTGGFQDSSPSGESSNTDSGGFSPPKNPQQSLQSQSNPSFQPPQAPSFQAPQTPAFQPPQPSPAQQQPGARPGQSPPTAPFGGQSGSYGMGVRQQVFEVIVRQALAGAPWREICAGPMQVNNISPDEVELEVKRRQSLLNK